jgi:hypothetical protein
LAKGERAVWHDLKQDSLYPIVTYRGRCQVHRVYHVISRGLALHSSFITGQSRLALSLRGPAYYHTFKEIVHNYLLQNHRYIQEAVNIGPGVAADAHRNSNWNIFCPRVSGRNQRRNRLTFLDIPHSICVAGCRHVSTHVYDWLSLNSISNIRFAVRGGT